MTHFVNREVGIGRNYKTLMKTGNWFLKGGSSLMIAGVLLLLSCHETDFTDAILSHIQSEAVSDSYQSEPVDMSSVAVNNTSETLSGGRYTEGYREVKGLGDIDDRFKCAVVNVTKDASSTTDKPSGKITIDFGAGCADAHGKTRRGIITVSYSGKRFLPGSVITVTVQNYYVNSAKVEGTLTMTNISPTIQDYPKFEIRISGGKIIFPDGRQATRDQSMTHEWQRTSDPTQDKWVVEGTASGSNKNGKSYQMKITSSLIYAKSCEINGKAFIPVKGIKNLTVDSKQIIMDYGDGSCDNTVTVTVNGKSRVETIVDNGK